MRNILYHQLFGIDINPSALGIAAFSLYLAALEFDEEPITDITELKFDRLIGTTLFEVDTIGEDLSAALVERPFEAVVDNSPWTFDKSVKAKPRKKGNARSLRPRRSRDGAFLVSQGVERFINGQYAAGHPRASCRAMPWLYLRMPLSKAVNSRLQSDYGAFAAALHDDALAIHEGVLKHPDGSSIRLRHIVVDMRHPQTSEKRPFRDQSRLA